MQLPHDWTDDDNLIVCFPWTAEARGLWAQCELCGGEISAMESTLDKTKTKGWHIICSNCFVEVAASHPVKLAGRYGPGEPPPWETN